MGRHEALGERLAEVAVREGIGMSHRELEALLVVAHAELERELLFGVGKAMLAKPRDRACLEIVEDRGQIAGRDVRKATDVARREFPLHVGDEEPEGREDAGRRRNDRERAAEKLHERVRVQRSGAAESDERKAARVLSALDGDETQPAQHVLVRDRDDRAGPVLEAHVEALCHLRDRARRELGVQLIRPPSRLRR